MLEKAYLEITNICNMACDFCHGTCRAPREMTMTEFETLTDRLEGEAEYLYFHLMGEPLSHPLLPQFIARAREKGFRPMLTTNGSLLGEVGEALLKSPPHRISISLHAPAANRAFAHPSYLNDCISFAKKAAAQGVIVVLRLWNLGGAGEHENDGILETLHAEFPNEWVKNRAGYRFAERLYLEWDREFVWPDKNAPQAPPKTDIFCYGLRNHVGILVDGTVVPCCLDADGVMALGNLFETPLQEILATPRARAIKTGFDCRRAVEPLCRTCGFVKKF